MFKDKVRKQDVTSIFKFIICFLFAFIYKLFHKDIWLISEREKEARDNGYFFFKYLCQNNLKKDCYYVIAKGLDYEKVAKLGKVIKFGSLRHHFFYLATNKHISSHIDGGMPNRRVCNFLERKGLLKNKKCFLQHGITKDVISFGFYENTRVNLFVCAAKPEYEFVKKTFGYPDDAVKLLGFARYDDLLDTSNNNRQILVMPTWRAWLAKNQSTSLEQARQKFIESEYFNKWNEFLSSKELEKILNKNNYSLVFYPHADMQPFVEAFKSISDKIIIASDKNYDVHQLLKSSNILITDYSSVAFDFAYMKKPLIYYHFDYYEYRKGQHAEGYFSYEDDGFGNVEKTKQGVINALNQILENNSNQQIFKKRTDQFFDLLDSFNCQRIFEAVSKI